WLERGAREDGDGPEIRSDLHVAGEVAGHDDEFLRVGEIRGVAVDDDPEAAVYVTAAIAHIDRAVPDRDNPAPGTHLHVDAEQREHCPGVVLQPGRAQRRPRLGRALERGIPGTDAPGEVRMLDQLVEDGVRSWLVSAVRGLARSHRWPEQRDQPEQPRERPYARVHRTPLLCHMVRGDPRCFASSPLLTPR